MSSEESSVEPTLPASWYHTPAMYELEKRAIFSKSWLHITHKNRFSNVGDFVKYEMAGYGFFIVKNREGQLRAFHNVCRHRAFPLVIKEEGNMSIISCGYHGWSYGLKGNLAKAPRFQDDASFKKLYSLYPIHLFVDQCGFVWVNLDANDVPVVSWQEQVGGVDTQERLNAFNMDDYMYNHSWGFEGEYNWKTLVDNYNECYHCGVAHPGIAATTDLPNYAVEMKNGFIAHFARPKPEFATANNSNVAPTYVFPSSAATINTVYLYITRCVPINSNRVRMEYEVYRHKDCTDVEFEEMDVFMKQIENEDRKLCTLAQQNLNAGVYETGPLNPRAETGVRYFKRLVKNALISHQELEQKEGREIWPAQPRRLSIGTETGEEVALCRQLCNSSLSSALLW